MRLRTFPGTSRIMFSQSGERFSSALAGLFVRSAPKKVSIFTWDSVGADAPGIFVCLNIAATRHDRRRAVRLPRKV